MGGKLEVLTSDKGSERTWKKDVSILQGRHTSQNELLLQSILLNCSFGPLDLQAPVFSVSPHLAGQRLGDSGVRQALVYREEEGNQCTVHGYKHAIWPMATLVRVQKMGDMSMYMCTATELALSLYLE